MNNDQFRKLVLANASPQFSAKNAPPTSIGSQGSVGALGSRQRASIPMTPRSVSGAQADFSRQLAKYNEDARPQKKFKTSAPKGVKLASGYVDRTQQRSAETVDDREERLKALEDSLKRGEIDRETYHKLGLEIAGGSLESTHLVKGLDFKLLHRVRQGEDVYGDKQKQPTQDDPPVQEDVDDAFDELEEREVHAMEKRSAEKKKGQLSSVPVAPGKKRTRDQILAELKASREAAKAKQAPSLGSKFKRIGTKQKPGTRIERDNKGREVLIIVDEDGHEKRKIRKIQPGEEEEEPGHDLLMPDPSAKPLGMEVPEHYRKEKEDPVEDKDVDIFENVGHDYDPLAGMDVSDSGSDSDSNDDKAKSEGISAQPSGPAAEESRKPGATDAELMPPPPRPAAAAATRDYFKDSKTGLMSAEVAEGPSMSDPAIMAAIKKAAALRTDEDSKAKEETQALEERRRKLRQMSDRDDADIDMGFGTSRFEDEEDFDDDGKAKLSVWGQEGAAAGSRGGQPKRKRGPKKRKGDANNAADVLRVMEQRKKS